VFRAIGRWLAMPLKPCLGSTAPLVLLALAGNAASPVPLSSASASPQPPASFPGESTVSISYYEVQGATAGAIRRAMNRQRPVDPFDHKAVDAYTKWIIRWHWDGDGQGHCLLSSVHATLTAEVRLPRLVPDGVPAPVLADWARYQEALIAHENGHVRNAQSHLGEVEDAVRGATCDTANARAAEVITRIQSLDRAFDRHTRHGMADGAVFPGSARTAPPSGAAMAVRR